MRSCSQEKRATAGGEIFRAALMCSNKLLLQKFCTAFLTLMLCTAPGAMAEPLTDLTDTKDDAAADRSDRGGDVLSRVDYLRDDERVRKEVRERREAKQEELDMKARQTRSLYDPFDGSEFQKKTFIDTDFRKQSFVDLGAVKRRSDTRPDDDAARAKDLFGKTADDRTSYYYAREKMKRDLREKMRDDKIRKELMKPNPDALHDWVPRAPDPIHNGSFEREPDNGTPVPYHLNGHPDFERKLPWAE
ncbi:MAG TPA: hypothetical protein PKZ32_09250 [Candidatus Melainabacteria bacterium]|nr:hypothetical protein [Candidatus Melainabacteria bacterium]